MIEQFRNTLIHTCASGGRSFSGIGLIITDFPEMLPIVSLRSSDFHHDNSSVVRTLSEISRSTSEYHDGFHILSTDGRLLCVSQYFSPPIVKDIKFDYSRRFGGRYVAALFGSVLPNVSLTGIVSQNGRLSVFERGNEVIFEVII